MIAICNLVMSIVEMELSGFRNVVKQPITHDIYMRLLVSYLIGCFFFVLILYLYTPPFNS